MEHLEGRPAGARAVQADPQGRRPAAAAAAGGGIHVGGGHPVVAGLGNGNFANRIELGSFDSKSRNKIISFAK